MLTKKMKDLIRWGARAALEHKVSRSDGELVGGLHPYRKLMAYIMPTRNGSVVYYDTHVRVDELQAYLEEVREHFHADITHCMVAAAAVGLEAVPQMNRFVVGRRLYRRKGRWLTFSMKRKKLDRAAKLAVVKLEAEEGETFRGLCEKINGQISEERTDKKTYMDKELGVLNRIPRPALEAGVRLLQTLDYFNVLPASFIRGDGMYTSMVIANLGSLGMAPGYHHLYEWGTCPIFVVVGKIEERPVVVEGEVVVQRVLPMRWSYDERIDDGLNASFGINVINRVLEDPRRYFGEGGLGRLEGAGGAAV